MSPLKFIALSGTTSVTENLYIYEYENDMIVVDCGVGFPDADMYGVDLVIPDFTYVRNNAKKLRAIVLTHGHEDHIGALPFLLKDVNVPVYGSPLTIGFVKDKLRESKLPNVKLNVFDPEKGEIKLGVFTITPFRVSHSIPDACGLCINTPEGKIFHVPDYKFDWTPVDGKPFDIAKAALLAQGNVLALASDALGANSPGHTESEAQIEKMIENIARDSKGIIYFSTISSNISRMQQAVNVAKKTNRKVCFIGRSIINKTEIARRLGYLKYADEMVLTLKQAVKVPKDKIMYVISGTYGQPGSALYRVAMGEHDNLGVGENDTVIFSADPAPPGAKQNVDFVVDRLLEMNVDVHYYDTQENLHVSGHGSQEDIKTLMGLVRPKFFIPIGGTIRHMRAYADIAVAMGAKKNHIIELNGGDVAEFSKGQYKRGQSIPVKDVLVDGLEVGDVGQVVLRDRQILASDGIAIVVLPFDGSKQRVAGEIEIISRGFVFEKKRKDFLEESAVRLAKYIETKKIVGTGVLKREAVDYLEKYFFDQTGRRPMVLPVVVEE
ncbi:ribonuclease J [Candidatus Woesebacteria bacterium]|jgi:ribonuclease J|nr:ribonuclease J [Candidatus Woesebacteria bacterium]